jgi:16S rRNA (uracil1498-N3)-methyltransferase
MTLPRFYQASPLIPEQTVTLTEDVFGHAIRVLRLPVDEQLILFNGDGNDYVCQLTDISKKQATAKVLTQLPVNNESPVHIHLGQVISRGDRMDFVLQKSVELGVNTITPLFSERCGVKLTGDRLVKRQQQWQKIVHSACEQCGRAVIPQVMPPIELTDWLNQPDNALKLSLHPRAQGSISQLPQPASSVRLVIGPEGGLSADELAHCQQAGFIDVLMGPRVLRTETAALAAITLIQSHFGDL